MDSIQSKHKSIIFITGASGVGKTTLIENLKLKYIDSNCSFFHFDAIGVPSVEEMIRAYGSPNAWQEQITYQWIKKLLFDVANSIIYFEGQVNLSFIIKGFLKYNFVDYRIILLDCNETEMSTRLTYHRNQPELFTDDMKKWRTYLKNQALELGVSIIDTTYFSEESVLQRFEELIDSSSIIRMESD